MADATTTMMDTIGTDFSHIPNTVKYVAGYVTGSDGIDWTTADWDRFANARHVRIWQGNGATPAVSTYDAIDVEDKAVTPQQAADAVRERVQAGIQWTTIYGSDSSIAEVSKLVQAMGKDIWDGHVNAWLANWDLNEAEAAKLIGTSVHGMTCIGVQWASPSSNPNTLIPGTSVTLKAGNVDLSVVDATWIPSHGWGGTVVATPPPAVTTEHGFLVTQSPFSTRPVSSTDSGKTWH